MDELNDNEINEKVPNRYLLGILGAFLGALVATIPWILMYVYGNMILSALAIVIAIGALKGYQIFKGKIDNKLPIVISVVSLLAVVLATLVITPMLLIIQEGEAPTIANLKLLYSYDEFSAAIMHDFIISVVFTILGISGVVANVKRKINESDEPLSEIKISDTLSSNQAMANGNPDAVTVKDIFVKHNAMSKQNAITKDVILSEIGSIENGRQIFNTLKTQQIIRKSKGKYYFSEKAENSVMYRFGIIFGKIMLIILLVVVIGTYLIYSFSSSSNVTNQNTTNRNNATNQSNSSDTTKSDVHDLTDFGMRIIAPSKMTYTDSATTLNTLLGSGSSDFYEFAIYNKTELISCFIQDTDTETVDLYYKTLKENFSDYTILSDYKTENISGFDFTTFEAQKEYNGELYNDLCLGYFKDGKFVFFEYTFPVNTVSNGREVIEKMIKKI